MAKSKMPQRYMIDGYDTFVYADKKGEWVEAKDANKLVNEVNQLRTRVQELEETCKTADKFLNVLYTDDTSLGGFVMSKNAHRKLKKLENSLKKVNNRF